MNTRPLHIAIITEYAMSKTHGTGSQVLQMFGSYPDSFTHFYFHTICFGLSECRNSHVLQQTIWLRHGQRTFAKMLRMFGSYWWTGDEVNPWRFRHLLKGVSRPFDVAYVIVSSEQNARKALSLLGHLQCPYVVHVMDIFHDELDPETMPGFAKLLEHGESVLVLNAAIQREIRKFTVPSPEIIPVGRKRFVNSSGPTFAASRFRILVTGRPYTEGVELLVKAWPEIIARVPTAEVAYVGAHFSTMSIAAQGIMSNLGYVSDSEFDEIVAGAQVGFLSGPLRADCFGKFSIPSRVTDFLMVGLPVVACVESGSPSADFLKPVMPRGAVMATTAPALVEAIVCFAQDESAWRAASVTNREFSERELVIDKIRDRIWQRLEDAASAVQRD
jgi:hypothetical protein